MELDRPARAAVVVIELAVAVVLSWVVSPWFTLVAVAALIAAMAVAVSPAPGDRWRGPAPPSPAGYIPRWFSKRAYCLRKSKLAFPVGPFLCLATSISASSARSIGTSSLYSDSR